MYRTRTHARLNIPSSYLHAASMGSLGYRTAAGDFLGIGKALKKLSFGGILQKGLGMIPGVGPILSTAAGVLTNPQKRQEVEHSVLRSLPFGTALGQLSGFEPIPGPAGLSTLPTMQSLGQVLPASGGSLVRGGSRVPRTMTRGGGQLPSSPQFLGFHKHHRRMNYMNSRAARRAGRRLKGALKLLESLKRSLPHVSHGHVVKGRKGRR